MQMADNLGVTFDLKDIEDDEAIATELIEKGERQVPFLVDTERDVMMYESNDIIDYIREHYASTAANQTDHNAGADATVWLAKDSMNISFNYNNHEEAQGLAGVPEEKLLTLSKFVGEEQVVICTVDFDKVAASKHGNIFQVAVNFDVAGHVPRRRSRRKFRSCDRRGAQRTRQTSSSGQGPQGITRQTAGRAFKRLIGRQG